MSSSPLLVADRQPARGSVLAVSERFSSAPYERLFEDAQKIRAHRDAFATEVEAGNVPIATVFDRAGSDPVLASMKVLGVIEGQPDLKKVQTRRAFEDLGISESAHIGDVTAEQRMGLSAALEKHAR